MVSRENPLDLPPERMRELGHQVVDLVVDHLTGLRDQPVRTLATPPSCGTC